MPDLPDTFDIDVPAVPEGGVIMPGNVQGDRFATDAEIGQAVEQLDAGQPVTALPRQDWSFQQAQAFNAKLDAFDQQAKAARAASEQAGRDAAMLDQMSRVAKSTKDIEIALRTQDEIGFRNSVASGVPPVQALTRFPRAASSPLVRMIESQQQAPAPAEVTLPSGQKGVRSGVHGERFTFAPAVKVEKEFQPREASLSDGTKIVFNPATGAFRLLTVKGEEKPMTASQLVAIANALPSKDPNAKAIFSFLSNKATNQLSGATAPAAGKPAAPAAAAAATRVRRKSDGKPFNYRGNPADIPRDQYDVLP